MIFFFGGVGVGRGGHLKHNQHFTEMHFTLQQYYENELQWYIMHEYL